jgi:hypothetical protein
MLPRQSKILDTDDTDDTDPTEWTKIGGRSPCLSVSYALIGWRRRFAGQFRRQNGIPCNGAQGRFGHFAACAPPHDMGTPKQDGHPRPLPGDPFGRMEPGPMP